MLKERVAELRPVHLPPEPTSRTSYVVGEVALFDLWFPPAPRTHPGAVGSEEWVVEHNGRVYGLELTAAGIDAPATIGSGGLAGERDRDDLTVTRTAVHPSGGSVPVPAARYCVASSSTSMCGSGRPRTPVTSDDR